MKKALKIMMIVMGVLFMLTGGAWAGSVTYSDDYFNFPGWPEDPYPGINYNVDVIGTPDITSVTVNTTTYKNNTYLASIVVQMLHNDRRVPDSLFINTNYSGDYDSWNYYVHDTLSGDSGMTLYNVGSTYEYGLSTYGQYGYTNARWNHPSSITSGITADTNDILTSLHWDSTAYTLTYTFNVPADNNTNIYGIILGNNYAIGYTEWCSNDVFLVTVPEPGIMLLLGLGFVGVGLIRRKIQ